MFGEAGPSPLHVRVNPYGLDGISRHGDSISSRSEVHPSRRAGLTRPLGRWARSPGVLVIAVAVALAALATVFQIPLTAAQAVALPAKFTDGPVPLDPVNAVWSEVTPLTVALSAQLVQIPTGGGNVPSLVARAVFNSTWLSVLIEWPDPTKDMGSGTAEFSDAVAIQFVSTSDGQPPYVCMGQANFQTQVWHWKAERDALADGTMDLAQFYDKAYGDWYPFEDEATFYPGLASGNFLSLLNATPVQVLVAGGAGTLTSTDHRTVLGAGLWEGGTWRVVFARTLAAANRDEIRIAPGVPLVVSFAAWDGATQERNGQKSTSSWYEMPMSVPSPGGATDWLLRAAIVVALIVVILLIFRGRREKRVPLELPEGIITLDRIPEEPEDRGRRRFLQTSGVAAAGVAFLGLGKGVGDEVDSPDTEQDWSEKRSVIDAEFEQGYRNPRHLR